MAALSLRCDAGRRERVSQHEDPDGKSEQIQAAARRASIQSGISARSRTSYHVSYNRLRIRVERPEERAQEYWEERLIITLWRPSPLRA